MFVLPLILAATSLLSWIALTFFWGAFWRLGAFDDDQSLHHAPQKWPAVVAVVPARNEAVTIERAIASLAGQSYKGRFQIVVVDDHSEDCTAALARQAAQSGGGSGLVTVRSAGRLEGGGHSSRESRQRGHKRRTISGLPMRISCTDPIRSKGWFRAQRAGVWTWFP